MLEIILLTVAFIGSIIAAFTDLKTTEIPDEVPYAMIGIAIMVHLVKSYLVWSYIPILQSCIAGLSFLGFGFLMYYFGQWGGGDAKILSAIGFLLPDLTGFKQTMFPFSFSFFFNVFFIGAIYMIVYALVVSMMNKNIWRVFVKDLKANSRMIMLFNVLVVAFLFVFAFLANRYYAFISLETMIRFEIMLFMGGIGLFLLWRFLKTVEEVGFKKKIPVSELREGDVLLDNKLWEGITKEQVKEIKKSKKHVSIKTGVRFAPAFPLSLIFTLYYGNVMLYLIQLLV